MTGRQWTYFILLTVVGMGLVAGGVYIYSTLPEEVTIDSVVYKKHALFLIAFFVSLILMALGGIKITSSAENEVEWLGWMLTSLGAGSLGIVLFLRGIDTDHFDQMRTVFVHRDTGSVSTEPALTLSGKTLTFPRRSVQWVAINFYKKGGERYGTEVLYHYELSSTKKEGIYEIPNNKMQDLEKIGVFYGTNEGPSAEGVISVP